MKTQPYRIGDLLWSCLTIVWMSACAAQTAPTSTFENDWKGEAPLSVRQLPVVADADPPIGLGGPGSICNGHLYLADAHNLTIHEIDLGSGYRKRHIGSKAAVGGNLRAPETAVALCDSDTLIALDSNRIVSFRISSGEFIEATERPPFAGPAMARAFAFKGAAVFSGYWITNREAFLEGRDPKRALDGFSLGYQIAATPTPSATPLLPLIDVGCRSMSANCLTVSIDRLSNGSGWLACQGGGATEVGVFSDEGRLVGKVNVTSPLFVNDGSTTRASDTVPKKIAWHQHNSTLKFCGAFGDYIASVHYILEPGDWEPGKAMAPRPFLNLHRQDGTRVLSDLRLRDYPVAKDEQHLYVLNFGENRATDGGRQLTMDVVRIIEESGQLNPTLRRQ